MTYVDLGFSQKEIAYGNQIYNLSENCYSGKIAQEVMQNDFEEFADIVKYYTRLKDDNILLNDCNKLVSQRVFEDIPTDELSQLSKHLLKMKNMFGRDGVVLTIDDFHPYALQKINTLCECRDLDGVYKMYNKSSYVEENKGIFNFNKKGNKQSSFITNLSPFAQDEEQLKNDKASIKKLENNQFEVTVDNQCIGLLNRFVMCVSLKPPVDHSGLSIVISSGGTKIYIYAIEFNGNMVSDATVAKKLGVLNSSNVIIGYGFTKKQLNKLIIDSTNFVIKKAAGRLNILVKPQIVFEEKINWLKEKETVDDNILEEL